MRRARELLATRSQELVEHAGKLSSVWSCAPGPGSSTPASWPGSRGLPAELVERLVEREAVARELSSVPGVWHQELSRPPGKLPAIEQPGPPGAHRGRRRASSMAPVAGQSCQLCGTTPGKLRTGSRPGCRRSCGATRPGPILCQLYGTGSPGADRVSCWPHWESSRQAREAGAGDRVKLASRAPVGRL